MIEMPALPCPERAPTRKRWTRQECQQLLELGLLTGRYELIDGEIISKMGQNAPHAYVIAILMKWLVSLFGGDYIRIQSPIDVAEFDVSINEPEPDAIVLSLPPIAFLDHIPLPTDVELVIEVADSSLRFDLTTKAALYARAGIPEYWVIDIEGRSIVAHRDPTPQGYAAVISHAESESFASLARPDTPVLVADLLPPA